VIKKKLNLKNLAIMQGRLVDSEKIGEIQFFPKKNWKKEMAIFKNNKFRFIEWVANIDNLKDNPINSSKKLKTIYKACKDYKIKIRSIDAQFFIKKPFFKCGGIERSKRFNLLKKIFTNSQKLKIKFFIVPALEDASISGQTDEKKFIDGIKKLSTTLKKGNYILIESDYKPLKLRNLIKKINHKQVLINYDTGNSAGLGYNFNSEKKYFNYVKNIHLKDKKRFGKSVRLGEGDANFKVLFNFLNKIRYKGELALQCARSNTGKHVEEIYKNIDYLKKLI